MERLGEARNASVLVEDAQALTFSDETFDAVVCNLGQNFVTPTIRIPLLAAVALIGLGLTAPAQAQQDTMSFFVTSVGKGNGADLGGLAGADAHCQALAQAAGSTKTNWHAYLSTTEPGGAAGVNARDRIGKGPWQNAKGVVVAKSVEDLHSDSEQYQQTDCPN